MFGFTVRIAALTASAPSDLGGASLESSPVLLFALDYRLYLLKPLLDDAGMRVSFAYCLVSCAEWSAVQIKFWQF